MSEKCTVIVGSDIPFRRHTFSGLETIGAVEGIAVLNPVAQENLATEITAMMERAKEALVTSALERGANLVNNLRCVELRHADNMAVVMMGDAWAVTFINAPIDDKGVAKPAIGYGALHARQ